MQRDCELLEKRGRAKRGGGVGTRQPFGERRMKRGDDHKGETTLGLHQPARPVRKR